MPKDSQPIVLAVDDDPVVLHALRLLVERNGQAFLSATTAQDGFTRFEQTHPDVVLCDILLPDTTGLDLLRRIHEARPQTPVILMTGHDSSDTAIRSTASGAFAYLPKPFSAASITDVVSKALQAIAGVQEPIASTTPPPALASVLIGRCPAMQEVYRAVGRVARQRLTVLLLGESGTGKELVARALHQHSGRASGPFVAVNCAAIPEALLESELFGHEKGAFTGADRRRIGRFEQASGGTLFLDEVGDMSSGTQAKVLRVLQDQTFERVGGNELLTTEARVIAATNRDLGAMCQSGRFRSDLYYRLAGYTIHLPPLRDRNGDLELLVAHFMARFRLDLNLEVGGLTPEALDRLRAHRWPGNIRELQTVLRQSMLEASGTVLNTEALRLGDGPQRQTRTPSADEGLAAFVAAKLAAGTKNLHAEWLIHAEPELLRLVLDHFEGNLTRAADALGLNRMTLRKRVEQYHLRETPLTPASDSPANSSPPATN
ncbi:MAG: sigma-54 dependent transcriptional regulator [Gemmataceae bacterium]